MYASVPELAVLADELRKEAGLSKRELADALGRDRANLARALNRPSRRDLQAILAMLEHFGVTVDSVPRFRIEAGPHEGLPDEALPGGEDVEFHSREA